MSSAKPQWWRRLGPWLGAILSGLLLILCYPPFSQGALAWAALVPLVAAVWWRPGDELPSSAPWWRRFLRRSHGFALGYLAGFIFFAGTFAWIGSLGTLFGVPFLKGVPLLLAAYLALYPAFWAVALRLLAPRGYRFDSSWRNLALATLAAASWVALEWVRGWLFSGFGWNSLAVAIRNQLGLVQIADLTGFYGVSWLVAFVNVMAVVLGRRLAAEFGPQLLRRVRWEFSAAVAVVCAAFAYGVYVQSRVDQPSGMQFSFRVGMLQPNVPERYKMDWQEGEEPILQNVGELTKQAAAQNPTLIIWPEATLPRGVFADDNTYQFLRQTMGGQEFNLLMGSLEHELTPLRPDTSRLFNSAMLFTANGEKWQAARKIHLVPFGEYLPFRPMMPPVITELVPGDLSQGTDFTVLQLPVPPLALGTLICFEDSLDNLARGYVRAGAQLLVNVTNDAWFLESAGAETHLANAQLRAVENRRPLLRCANTGITGTVDPFGRVDRWLPPFQRGVEVREITVAAERPLTFYTRHGDWFAYGCAVLAGLALARAGLLRRKRLAH